MNRVKKTISKAIVSQIVKYLDNNPEKHLPALYEVIKKIDITKHYQPVWNTMDRVIKDKDSVWHGYIVDFIHDIDINVIKKTVFNFFINTALSQSASKPKLEAKLGCRIPWAILMDPTSACNLQCTGCWAAEYANAAHMSYETLDRIITEGKELGVYFYVLSGGEPLVRKDDIIKLCDKHDDCIFLSFTNGTLIDEAFAKECKRVGNLAFVISIEGFEEETDLRRGKGSYRRAIQAMDTLKKEGIIFGFSACYHRKNTHVVGSEEYVNFMIEKGCKYGWYFTYIPIGENATKELLVTPEQREYMYHQVRDLRSRRPCMLIDFWNDGDIVNGCIAGARNYIHINANGDVEPCAFIHYSGANINNTSLLEALKQPLFKEYEKHQPFNNNHLRPCPLLDNPEVLREMVHNSNAKSTQLKDNESVDDLTAKCEDAAKNWAGKADELWEEFLIEKEKKEKAKAKVKC